ncbi:ATP-grasp domain-containing protein [Staphylococcus gallinarum]|uniref:ATP-grasp domain-containing protein n=1 Tax=Staphylococcus gallinarum TaxID=1293 RepID=UPI0030EECBE0
MNSDKQEPINIIKNKIDDLNVSVVTKTQYQHLYKGLTEKIYLVNSLEDFLEIRNIVNSIQKKESIDYVITPTEKGVLTGGFIRSFFGIDGPKFEEALATTNKLYMKSKVNEFNIKTAPFESLSDLTQLEYTAQEIGYPIIIKPAVGSGTKNTFKIESREDLLTKQNTNIFDELYDINVPLIVEKFIEMEEYHCDAIINDNQVQFLSISKYLTPPLKSINGYTGSFIIPTDSQIYNRLKQEVYKIVDNLSISKGPIHVELYHTNYDEILFGEIALRPGGGGISKTISMKYDISIWEKSFEAEVIQNISSSLKVNKYICGWVGLPCKNGKLLDFISKEGIYKVDNRIKHIEQHYKVNDTINENTSSTFYLYTLYFEVSKEEDIQNIMKKLDKQYYIVSK